MSSASDHGGETRSAALLLLLALALTVSVPQAAAAGLVVRGPMPDLRGPMTRTDRQATLDEMVEELADAAQALGIIVKPRGQTSASVNAWVGPWIHRTPAWLLADRLPHATVPQDSLWSCAQIGRVSEHRLALPPPPGII